MDRSRDTPDHDKAVHEPPVLIGRPGDAAMTRRLLRPVLEGGGPAWKLVFLVTFAGSLLYFGGMAYTFVAGIGVWGNNIPVAWAFAITNFVWWIGIGHAGTFISAILLLLEQPWRTSINRFAEAMTLFAILIAASFPVLHLGRPWFAYWIFPYPATMGVWPQFRSSLPWDLFAIATYGTVSLMFWYLGLVPDLAAARAVARERWRRRLYGIFALGFRGSSAHWNHYRVAYGLLAGLATPLVLSVHSIVSLDFAIAQLPGWHSTIFPPYFVSGAIYSGFAMVLTLMVPIRSIFRLKDVITERHLDAMAKMTLVTGWVLAYDYLLEGFLAWYGGEKSEMYVFLADRLTGPLAPLTWYVYAVNFLVPATFFFRKARRTGWYLFLASILIQVAMWLERLTLIVTSLHRDFLPSSWHSYVPTFVDGAIILGSISFFFFLFALFLRFVPFVPVTEIKELSHELAEEESEEGEARPERKVAHA